MVMGDMAAAAEVVVLGGGPGGYAAAFRAADRGLETVLVTDEERLGGVCLLRGCIPSKALLEMTGRIGSARDAREAGIRFSDPELDPRAMHRWTDGIVERLASGLGKLADARNVRVLRGRGRFEGPGRLGVHGGDVSVVEFEHAIIATGSRPVALPGVAFTGPVMDSAAALELRSVPERLLVVGGGYVGMELGTVYARLGAEVVLVEERDRILPGVDADLVRPVQDAAGKRFAEIRTGVSVTRMTVCTDSVRVSTGESDQEETFDRALIAIGRRPNSEDLGLDAVGVRIDEGGSIVVDERRRTSAEKIYAVGDVVGGMGLAHEAMREGKVAADVIAGEPSAYDVRAVPAVVYTEPEIAFCGLDERRARESSIETRIGRFPLSASGRALTMGGDADRGLIKLVASRDGRVLGGGIVGPEAESLIAEIVLAVEMGATMEDLALTVHPHPTLSEGIAEAAERLLGRATHFV